MLKHTKNPGSWLNGDCFCDCLNKRGSVTGDRPSDVKNNAVETGAADWSSTLKHYHLFHVYFIIISSGNKALRTL